MRYFKSSAKTALIFVTIVILTILSQQVIANIFIRDIDLNSELCVGYTLISPREDRVPFLIDMDGKIIHNYTIGAYPAKMLCNGTIIGSRVINEKLDNFGRDGTLYKFVSQENWEGEITWEFCNWSDGWARQHHDLHRVGNQVYYSPAHKANIKGNTLILARTDKTINKSISLRPLQDGVIYEIDWQGNLTGFEWHASEHYDELGFDRISRIGIFLFPAGQGWLHLNTCSELGENKWYEEGYEEFNPSNIITCSRHANFIIIINRTTGKIEWKLGPNYRIGLDKKTGLIIGPHHAHIIPKGLPGEGNILIFDNGGFAGYGLIGGLFNFPFRYMRFFSRILEIDPITKDIVWEYISKGRDDPRFYSTVISSVQRLANGNTLITEGTTGRIFEINKQKEILWEYNYKGNESSVRNNWVYRAYRVPPEWIPGNPSAYQNWSEVYGE